MTSPEHAPDTTELPPSPAAPHDVERSACQRMLLESQTALIERTNDTCSQPATSRSLDEATLFAAAVVLQNKMSQKDVVEATILSVPPHKRAALSTAFEKVTGKSLKQSLNEAGLETAGALLEAGESASERSWLKQNLSKLDQLAPGSSARNIVEMSIRSQIRTLSETQLKSLNDEILAGDQKTLKQILDSSSLSQATKDILEIYQKNPQKLSSDHIRKIAEIGLNSKNLSEEARLLIFKEALGGDAAKQARADFLKQAGPEKVAAVFRDSLSAQEALDILRDGKVHVASFIARQTSRIGNNDAGIEGVIKNFMSPEDRRLFGEGMALSARFPAPERGREREAYDYYKRVNSALLEASKLYASSRVVSTDSRRKQIAIWEDLALNGEETLLSRLAKARNDILVGAEGNKTVLGAIRNFSDKDFQLMKDPVYRKRVFALVGGEDIVHPNNSLFYDKVVSLNAQLELKKVFGAANLEQARSVARPDFVQIARGYSELSAVSNADLLNALGRARPAEWTELGKLEAGRNVHSEIEKRVKSLPDGAREAAERMLDSIKKGEQPRPGLTERVYEDMLAGAPAREIIRMLLQASKASAEPLDNNAMLEKALKASMRASEYERYGKPLIGGRGLSIEDLKEINWKFDTLEAMAAAHQRGMYAGSTPQFERPGYVEAKNFYSDLQFASAADRQRILEAQEKALLGDATARQNLDCALSGLSQNQREIAISILKNDGQKMGAEDRARAAVIGDGDLDGVVSELSSQSLQDKNALINNYQRKYGRFFVDDIMAKADENQKKQIMTALPESIREAYRVQMTQAQEQTGSLYGDTVPVEIALRQTQEMVKLGLETMPEADRKQHEQEIRELLKKYAQALKDNDEARDKYAEDLIEKLTTVAGTVAGPYAAAGGMTRLALSALAFGAFRSTVEDVVTGKSNLESVTLAGMFGALDVMPGPDGLGIVERMLRLRTGRGAILPDHYLSGLRPEMWKPALKDEEFWNNGGFTKHFIKQMRQYAERQRQIFSQHMAGYMNRHDLNVTELGQGWNTYVPDVLRNHLNSYTAVDIMGEKGPGMKMIKEELSKDAAFKGRLSFVAGDSRKLPIASASQDIVYTHAHNPLNPLKNVDDQLAVWREVHRILKDGGEFILSPVDWTLRPPPPEVMDFVRSNFIMGAWVPDGAQRNSIAFRKRSSPK